MIKQIIFAVLILSALACTIIINDGNNNTTDIKKAGEANIPGKTVKK